MLYYLFKYLQEFDIIGARLFDYISFRSLLAIILSLVIAIAFGKFFIKYLKRKQINENVRNLGLQGEEQKKQTPSMGGVIIITSILIPTLLFADITNIYIIFMIITTIWLGLIGFIDDYIKIFRKNKAGLSGRYKIIGQVGLGLIIGTMFYFNPQIKIRETVKDENGIAKTKIIEDKNKCPTIIEETQDIKSTKTNIPFFKNNEFDYSYLVSFMGKNSQKYAWIAFVLVAIFIITAVSNGANITDGIDGLAAGTSAIIGITLAIFAYVSGNTVFAHYLNIMYIPNSGELVVFISAFIGACVGFLWYNSYPAKIFMGDTGSLTLGGIIAVFAIAVRKELLIPMLCGVFLIENLSVILQVGFFKWTRILTGTGRRIFKCAPLHHHYQKLGHHEPQIVVKFWIIAILFAVLSLITLKIR